MTPYWPWGRIHVRRVDYIPSSYPAVKNTAPEYMQEGAVVGVERRVAITRELAVKRRVVYSARRRIAYSADINTGPGQSEDMPHAAG